MQDFLASALALAARMVTGVRPIWQGCEPAGRQRIYFANHASHADFILLSACLGAEERARTRAVAAADYWGKTNFRRLIAERLLGALLVERSRPHSGEDPVAVMTKALAAGHSLILFPEGTRNATDVPLLGFRSGLYTLAIARPDVELVPCWLDNISRVLPKGEILPVPLLCRVIFGRPLAAAPDESRHAFLARARAALLALNPKTMGDPA